MEKRTPREQPANNWILDAMWALVDEQAMLRKQRMLSRAEASLKEDRKQRADDAASKIKSHLASGDLKEAWGVAKQWYRR